MRPLDHQPEPTLPWALLVLRVTLGLFLLQWGLEKFIVPTNASAIWSHFYGFDLGQVAAYAAGIIEIAAAILMVLGLLKTPVYGLALVIHATTTLVTIPAMLHPWQPGSSHLFIAAVPVLGAFVALFLLRGADRLALGMGGRDTEEAASTMPRAAR